MDRLDISPPSGKIPITSLPPEVLSQIFSTLLTHLQLERSDTEPDYRDPLPKANRQSLCLVNKLFNEIYSPILYREVHFNLKLKYEPFEYWYCSRYFKLVRTLTENQRYANLVKGLRISTNEAEKVDYIIVGYVLSHLNNLEWVRTGWEHPPEKEEAKDLVKMVVKHQPKLRSLELPGARLSYDTLQDIFSDLVELKSYQGPLPGPSTSNENSEPQVLLPNLECKLNKVVLTSPIDSNSFSQALRYSTLSLTSLALSLGPDDPSLILTPFLNLRTLRLHFLEEILRWDEHSQDFIEEHEQSLSQRQKDLILNKVRNTLLSSPPSLTTLSISVEDCEIAHQLCQHNFFDALPSSLVHLVSAPSFLRNGEGKAEFRNPNHATLTEAIHSRTLPHFRRITVIPPFTGSQIGKLVDIWQRDTVRELKETIGKGFGDIRINRTHNLGHYLGKGYGLDPYGRNEEITDDELPPEESDEDEDEDEDDPSDEESSRLSDESDP